MQGGGLDILGCRVDRVDMRGAVDRVLRLVYAGKPAHVVTLGTEMAMLASRDARYRDAINRADLVVPDTIGIVIASRILGAPLPERVAGIDLVETLCAGIAHSRLPIFFLGGEAGVAQRAADRLTERFPGLVVAGTHHGYFVDGESENIASIVRESGARLALVALGFPRQEFWIRENLGHVGSATCIGVGGTFDVLADRLSRAPALVQRVGLEWLFRLVREPRRIRRQLVLPIFVLRVLTQARRSRRARL